MTIWGTTVMPLAENVLAAAQASGATVMIPGNVYNFGTGIKRDMKENGPFDPDTEKGRLRVDMEGMFEAAAHESGVRTVVIRAGDFFGGKRPESWLDLMILKDLKKDRFTWPGPWDTLHAFAYLPDLAQAFAQVAEVREELAVFERLHFRGFAVTGDEFHRAAEQAAGRQLRRAGVPWTLLRLLGIVNPVLREVVKMSYLWRVPHSLDNSRLVELVGPEPHRPLAAALCEAIADLGLDGKRGDTASAGDGLVRPEMP